MALVELHLNITPPPANTTNVTVSPNQANCTVFLFVVNSVINGGLCIAGIIGNSLTIATLYRDSWKNVTSFLFSVLAACDVCALILTFLLKALPMGCQFYHDPGVCYYQYYIWPKLMKYLFGFTPIFLMGSVWITVLVTIHRTIAVKMPHRARTYSSLKRVRIQTLILGIIVVLFCVPRFFEIRTKIKANTTREIAEYTAFYRNKDYQIWYKNVAINIAVNVGPLIILCILTYILVTELHKALKDRQALSTYSPGDRGQGHGGVQLSILLILVVVVFLLCQTPHAVYAVMRAVIDTNTSCGHFIYFMNISDSLVVFNSGINFVLFCLAGKRFRSQLASLFKSSCKKTDSGKLLSIYTDHTGYGVHNHRASNTLPTSL